LNVLFERCAYRIVPQLVARTVTPVVYGKGYDMGGMYRLNEGLQWQGGHSKVAEDIALPMHGRMGVAGSMSCAGSPPTLGKLVRSALCRRAISLRLRTKATVRSSPLKCIANGTLYNVLPGSNCSMNQSLCCD